MFEAIYLAHHFNKMGYYVVNVDNHYEYNENYTHVEPFSMLSAVGATICPGAITEHR